MKQGIAFPSRSCSRIRLDERMRQKDTIFGQSFALYSFRTSASTSFLLLRSSSPSMPSSSSELRRPAGPSSSSSRARETGGPRALSRGVGALVTRSAVSASKARSQASSASALDATAGVDRDHWRRCPDATAARGGT